MCRKAAIAVTITIVGLLAGCSTAPIYLDEVPSFSPDEIEELAPCRLNLAQVRDVRRNKAGLGRVAGRQVESEEVLAWLTQGLAFVDIVPRDAVPSTEAGVELSVDLVMAHIRSVETSMCCDIVLEVAFQYGDTSLGQQRYRGSSTRLNWASGQDEVERCFGLALKDALEALCRDAHRICEEASSDKTSDGASSTESS